MSAYFYCYINAKQEKISIEYPNSQNIKNLKNPSSSPHAYQVKTLQLTMETPRNALI